MVRSTPHVPAGTKTLPGTSGLVPVPPAKADTALYTYGHDLRKLGASSFEVIGTHKLVARFGNPDKRVIADAVLKDTILGAQLVLTSPKPDAITPTPLRAAWAAVILTGVHHIDYKGPEHQITVVAKDAASRDRLAAILNPDFAGMPVDFGVQPPTPPKAPTQPKTPKPPTT